MPLSYDLKYHYRPEKGWMNDPNGLVFFDGYYHAFYQHAPHYEHPWHEPMAWGHARTKDFLHWEELPVALWADQPYDSGGCWSGTAIVHEDTLYLFYASVVAENGGYRQNVSMAWSKDAFILRNRPPIRSSRPIPKTEARTSAIRRSCAMAIPSVWSWPAEVLRTTLPACCCIRAQT